MKYSNNLFVLDGSIQNNKLGRIDATDLSMNTSGEIEAGQIDLPYPCGTLELKITDKKLLKNPQFTIRFRSEGDEVKLANRNGSKKLKKLFQEWQIPPWMRNYVPMLFLEDDCIAIADYALCEFEQGELFEKIKWHPVEELEWRLNHDQSSTQTDS